MRQLYAEALDLWGLTAQVSQLAEECAELIVAIHHLGRKRVPLDSISEELADVEIMVEQIRAVIGDDAVDEARRFKLDRLAERIHEEKSRRENEEAALELARPLVRGSCLDCGARQYIDGVSACHNGYHDRFVAGFNYIQAKENAGTCWFPRDNTRPVEDPT